MILFFVGIIEMIIVTAWTKVVADTRLIASGIITFINILIWYYVLRVVIDNIENFTVVLSYALGCSIGTMFTTYYFRSRDKKKSIIPMMVK
ncbi:MAG: DUF5698 domain-containing protein [Patescibacteria group bacterium]|nr:DUF5698 domain-containing protein [Patescibacteria group bacterium]MDD4610947.1 DUF5698 domain-containing protein [Patescibacteria group bacterium]